MSTIKNEILLDTVNVTDKESEINEALNNLFKVCKKYNVTSYASVVTTLKTHVRMHTMTTDSAKIDSEYDYLANMFGRFLDRTSGGTIQLFKIKPDSEEISE